MTFLENLILRSGNDKSQKPSGSDTGIATDLKHPSKTPLPLFPM